MITPNELLKELAASAGVSKKQLLVLADANDPFNTGTPAHIRDAEWVTALNERHPAPSTHLRRLHYRAVSEPATLPNGEPYVNDDQCWTYLQNAAKFARVLGMIDARTITDHRSSPWQWTEPPEYPRSDHRFDQAEVDLPESAYTGQPDLDLSDLLPELTMPSTTSHYTYRADDQPRIAIVVEKSTIDDVLRPVARRHNLELLSATGYVSHTRIREWMYRDLTRPARVLYISDFDPAGSSMPTAFARSLEGMIWRDQVEVDFAVTPIALTIDQVHEYELPTVPMKKPSSSSIAGKQRKFLDRFGVAGAVELDALVATHPGELEHLIIDEVEQIRDPGLKDKFAEVEDDAHDLIGQVWEQHEPEITAALNRVKAAYLPAAERVIAANDALREAYDELLLVQPDTTELNDQLGRLASHLSEVTFPDRPAPVDHDDPERWLYRSDRDYLEQLHHYRGGSA